MKKSIGIIIGILLLSATGIVSALNFDVAVTVCQTDWYCTNYSNGDCGTRTCIDNNACGHNQGKPSEVFQCASVESPAGGGGSGAVIGSDSSSPSILSNAYFDLNYNLLKIDMKQETLIQKIIKITGNNTMPYTLEVIYPREFNQKNDFITLTKSTAFLENGVSEFGIIFDSKNVSPGIYLLTIKVSNGQITKELLLNVKVVLEQITETISIEIISKEKIFETNQIEYVLDSKTLSNQELTIEENILDPKGNIVNYRVFNVTALDKNVLVELPQDIGEGYYTLKLTIHDSKGNTYYASQTIAVLNEKKYSPIKESPKITQFPIQNYLIAILGIVVLTFVINKILTIRLKNKVPIDKKPVHLRREDVVKRVKKLYDNGFINLKEYNAILSENGYDVVTKNKIENIEEQITQKTKDIAFEIGHQIENVKHILHVKNYPEDFDIKTSEDKVFYTGLGEKLYSIKDLINSLNSMPLEVFAHHTTGRNDFAKWIDKVFGNTKLSKEVKECRSVSELKELFETYKK